MSIDLEVIFRSEHGEKLCFRHAVLRAIMGQDVTTEIDNRADSYYGEDCCECRQDRQSECIVNEKVEEVLTQEEIEEAKKKAEEVKKYYEEVRLKERGFKKYLITYGAKGVSMGNTIQWALSKRHACDIFLRASNSGVDIISIVEEAKE